MSTFLIPETWTHIGRREEDNLKREIMEMVLVGKRRRGQPRHKRLDNSREDMKKNEMTADNDMTENRQYWKMTVKTGPQIMWRWSSLKLYFRQYPAKHTNYS